MKYIFINPVIDQMYVKEELDETLLQNGYQRVEVETDWHKLVKQKYNEILKQTKLTVLDKRCPKVMEVINPYLNHEKLLVPAIEPILIHCAIELAGREDLRNQKKIITTPCESLASYGNKIGLEDTEFISWKVFLKKINLHRPVQVKVLGASPIPPGYFKTLEAKISSISGKENIESYFKMNLYKQDELVEMLYCQNGCHNGDGVLVNE
ncbi:hypothetical protein CS063_11200 [Sporanaerobium hydrogeniformans]|uniref:Uncharacterized protein n=1 Tax=Sporanaerobium hydrogeniformans TaxID=3072179 RepID=A0AC61DAG8_9FIRM|nr:hypothetical protein [Sporanaerobium hydrogeniformans]PHV70229.1 hypothetical protein CS063_11200 [Sporanaerobium hydrogeniformans]